MNTSADALLEACRNFCDNRDRATDLQLAASVLDDEKRYFEGVNNNLSQACEKAGELMHRMDWEALNIIDSIVNNIEAFAESSKSNENQTLNVLNDVNEQIEAISTELGYK